jgi:ATP-dependent helicase HepA
VLGALVAWGPHEQLGVIQGLQIDGDGQVAEIGFDDGSTKFIKTEAGVLQRVGFAVGDQVMRDKGHVGVILKQVTADNYPTWKVSFPGEVTNVAEIGLRPAVIQDPIDRLRRCRLGTAEDFNLRSTAADYWFSNQHSALVSLAHARVDLKPHQVSVVHRVVSNYPHRFMLCDEVGLGKTIEAAMVIKELRARGQAQRVLILVPPGLTRQWQFELKTKFNQGFAIYNAGTVGYLKDKGAANPWMENESVIASHTWASWTKDRRREIAEVPWDMIIVDEAHHARARRQGNTTRTTKLYSLVSDLVARPEAARRAVLLITATPLQLERYELYSLCDMLNPVLFTSETDFDEHMNSLTGLNRTVEQIERKSLPENDEKLAELEEAIEHFLNLDEGAAYEILRNEPKALAEELRTLHRVSEVLIRNRKAVVGGFQPRRAATWEVDLSDRERRVHELMDSVFERGFARAAQTRQNTVGFQMVILQKLLASSSRALLVSLSKRRERLAARSTPTMTLEEAETALEEDSEAAEVVSVLGDATAQEIAEFDEIISDLKQIRLDSKAKLLRSHLKVLFGEDPDAKVLIFTEFRETQAMLQKLLAPLAEVHVFHGQLSGEQKDSAVSSFHTGQGAQILVSTEAGGEGRNFQFCHILVNYDLPWNPMKVEQRIGRVDRIGQEDPVVIFNFHVKGTIEGRILEVLERRINIFEEAVGGLDPILGEAETDIRTAVALAADERDAAMERLGVRLELEVERARSAEKQAADFIMDAKSFVAEIARKAAETEAPISQAEFEEFEIALLRSVNTYIGPCEDSGERRIFFHTPFTLEHPELVAGQEVRRVCFDPRLNTDSELVEYLGFGHPIIDALVRRTTEHRLEGTAAIRKVDPSTLGLDRPGWQFNWIVTVGGLSSGRSLFPVFVPDGAPGDSQAGVRLLQRSRKFLPETSNEQPPFDHLDEALALAQEIVVRRRDEELATAQSEAAGRAGIEKERIRALFGTRAQAAKDRVESCRQTLERLRKSDETYQSLKAANMDDWIPPDAPRARNAIPLWQANLARAESELEMIHEDLEQSLSEISRHSQPTAEFTLLNIARIEFASAD